jgi:DNA repair exonuclease SbcCD ATPase subunit
MASKFSDEERSRVIAEADYYTGRGPRPSSLDRKPEPKPVRKEAQTNGLVHKVHISEPVAVDAGQEWAAYIERRIEDALAPLQQAVGQVLASEREREREAIKTAIDRLDHDVSKAIAVREGKAEGRANALENRLEREVREMQQRVDRAEQAMNDARMELLALVSEFRIMLNDAAEAQRALLRWND